MGMGIFPSTSDRICFAAPANAPTTARLRGPRPLSCSAPSRTADISCRTGRWYSGGTRASRTQGTGKAVTPHDVAFKQFGHLSLSADSSSKKADWFFHLIAPAMGRGRPGLNVGPVLCRPRRSSPPCGECFVLSQQGTPSARRSNDPVPTCFQPPPDTVPAGRF